MLVDWSSEATRSVLISVSSASVILCPYSKTIKRSSLKHLKFENPALMAYNLRDCSAERRKTVSNHLECQKLMPRSRDGTSRGNLILDVVSKRLATFTLKYIADSEIRIEALVAQPEVYKSSCALGVVI